MRQQQACKIQSSARSGGEFAAWQMGRQFSVAATLQGGAAKLRRLIVDLAPHYAQSAAIGSKMCITTRRPCRGETRLHKGQQNAQYPGSCCTPKASYDALTILLPPCIRPSQTHTSLAKVTRFVWPWGKNRKLEEEVWEAPDCTAALQLLARIASPAQWTCAHLCRIAAQSNNGLSWTQARLAKAIFHA